jgi:hypothetical protein
MALSDDDRRLQELCAAVAQHSIAATPAQILASFQSRPEAGDQWALFDSRRGQAETQLRDALEQVRAHVREQANHSNLSH